MVRKDIEQKYKPGTIYGIQKIINLFRDELTNGLCVEVECIKCNKRKILNRPRVLLDDKYNSCTCQNIKHNLYKTKLYNIYHNIKYRCYNPNHHEFHNYGGKGITMSEEWLGENGFLMFYNWALENGYKEGLTIDRIDSNKNYESSNCQWITRSENTIKSNKICQHRKANKGRYYGVSPDGVRYEFDNASQFSKEHNLNDSMIRRVANKERKTHKGWIFGFVSEEDGNNE